MRSKKSLIYNHLKEFALENNLHFLAVYGSYHKDNQKESSDLDLIVDLQTLISNNDLENWKIQLESILELKVDIISTR